MVQAKQLEGDRPSDIPEADYRALARLRHEVRKFTASSVKAARSAGLEAQQYQALLAVRAYTGEDSMSTTALADELFISVPAAVELLNRLEAAGLVLRRESELDRRRKVVELTAEARKVLTSLASTHRDELQRHVPALMAMMTMIGGLVVYQD